jgi:PST family polysaccharide transporter
VGWFTIQTAAAKGANFAAQLVLAWLLGPRDFGRVGLAYTISAFGALLQQAGVREVLVRRQRRFGLWAPSAFWMSLAMGVAAGAVMAATAPLVAAAFRSPQLTGLILVLAVAAPLQAAGSVPAARLQASLRFKALAAIGTVGSLAGAGLTVLFAALKFEAYSFVLPIPIVALFQSAAYWVAAPPVLRGGLRLRRWRYLAGESTSLISSAALTTVVAQGDYVVLGLIHNEQVVGVYYYAFVLSMQAVGLLVSNLSDVLFPVLSRLNDEPARQGRAFLRAARAFMLVGVPGCMLQAAVARPLMEWLFKPEWSAAIPLVQLLSLSAALRLPIGPSSGLMKAQGRFRDFLRFSLFNVVLFQMLATAGALWGAATGVAVAVVFYSAVIGPVSLYLAASPSGARWRDLSSVYAVPFLGGFAAVGLGLACAALAPAVPPPGTAPRAAAAMPAILRTAITCGVALSVYGAVLMVAAPEVRDLVLRRLRPRRAADALLPPQGEPGALGKART